MKFLNSTAICCILVISLVSCSNGFGNLTRKLKDQQTSPSIAVTSKDGMDYLGTVNKVYSASPTGRFVTGQVIKNFYGHTVKFEGHLVEYTSIKQEILDYVENLKNNNALMHQCYENIIYDSTKKYVEFSSYTDVKSNKILCFEIRVFFGNFLDTYNESFWYAKSVTFNSGFTKDIDNNIAVDFGEPLGNPEDENLLDENTSESPIIPEKQEDKINYDYINAIGKVSKIYSAHNVTARFATGQEIDYNGKKVRFQGNLVEYHSVNAKILDIFTNIQPNALHHQGYSNFVFENSKIYIEVCYYEDMVTGEILEYELRYTINPVYEKIKKEEWQGEWYAKSFSFTDLSTIKE